MFCVLRRRLGRFFFLFFLLPLLLFAKKGKGPSLSFISFDTEGGKRKALLCKPIERGEPFPGVLYNHSMIVDIAGYQAAKERGYDLDGICRALAKLGYLTIVPIRETGRGNILGHLKEVLSAMHYLRSRSDVEREKIALMGFSRGGLLTLMAGIKEPDASVALLILAPAPGHGHFERAVHQARGVHAPVLLLVEASDDAQILEDYESLKQELQANRKRHVAIRYQKGGGHHLFWKIGYYWEDVKKFLADTLHSPSR